ncbi:MAG: sigma-70 family RNA polymerase sigma factor [Clostridiaceae bacterium]|nr:sigma-70 family RNA polymerase sigma factor [Clostridiaceae bacterium]
MSYNKAREERKWHIWKDAEENQMRELGVHEDTLEELRIYDWTVFNSNRRFYRRLQDASTCLEEFRAKDLQPEIRTIEDFLDCIEDERLYHILITVDEITLQIALMKMQGYSNAEIAGYLCLTPKAIYRRMDRLKEKLKILFE